MTAATKSYEIPAYAPFAIPDGDRWMVVYHDGDEESTTHIERDSSGLSYFRLGPTSGEWTVVSMAGPPEGVRRAGPDA